MIRFAQRLPSHTIPVFPHTTPSLQPSTGHARVPALPVRQVTLHYLYYICSVILIRSIYYDVFCPPSTPPQATPEYLAYLCGKTLYTIYIIFYYTILCSIILIKSIFMMYFARPPHLTGHARVPALPVRQDTLGAARVGAGGRQRVRILGGGKDLTVFIIWPPV